MGDVVERTERARRRRLILSAVLAVAVAVGCSSSQPARVVESAPARGDAAAEARVAPPAEIRSLEVREGAPDVIVELLASAPLVWTSFRNAEGQVVLELPNAVPGTGVADVASEDGLVSALRVTREDGGERPMTRLVIVTRQEAEHAVSADGARLQLRLLPVDGESRTAARPYQEPVAPARPDQEPAAGREPEQVAAAAPAPAPAAPAVEPEQAYLEPAPAPQPVTRVGTPDEPAVGPTPAGATATRLDGIQVLASQGGAVVEITGDGEFPYATFALADPARFVIDLSGVVNRAARSTVAVDGSIVERVRVGQFKPQPTPVARVVFDLRETTVPRIERTAETLVVTFPAGALRAVDSQAEPAVAAVAVAALAPPAAIEPAPAQLAPAVPAPGTIRSQQAEPAPARLQAAQQEAFEVEEAEEQPARQEPSPTAQTAQTAQAAPPSATANQPSDLQLRPAAAAPTTTAVRPGGGFASQDLGSIEAERKYVGDPIDLKVINADVTDVLRSFAQLSGLNIIIQPGVTGLVTAELENVPWDQALEQVLRINKLGYEVEGNIMRIAPTKTLRDEARERQELVAARALAVPLRTVMKRLNYAEAGELSRLLRAGSSGLLSQRGSVIVDARTNTLIIKELPNFMDAVIGVIEMLDSPEPQVMIEARIIETTKRFNRDLGIRWGFLGTSSAATGNTSGLVFPNNGSVEGSVDVSGTTQNILDITLGNVLGTFELDVELQALENEGLINILSAPKVATLNNQRASIQSGLQIPVQTVANNTGTVQYINATLRLDVTPQVTAEGTVMMDIDISKREPQLAFLVPGANNAPIATKDARTRLVVRDGGTAVIGGIYKVSTDEGQERIPGLANIPIIGNLFKNKSQRDENEELLIFITPRIIKI